MSVKRKQKNRYLLKPGWTRACGCAACRRGSYWMWLVVDADECKEKRKKKNTYLIKCELMDADGGCGWWTQMVVDVD